MAGGRPTDYRPEYCEKVIEYGKEGLLPVSMASRLRVTKETLHQWARVHPAFSDAFNEARIHCESFHMERAVQTAHGERAGNAPMTKFILSAAFGYREASESVNTMQNPDGTAIEAGTRITIVRPPKRSDG